MKANELMTKVSGGIKRAGFGIQKHSPEILIVAGIIGTVTGAVMACKATMKLGGILEEHDEDMALIRNGATVESADDAKKATAAAYVHTAGKIAKLYLPSVAVGALSLSSIVASNNILRKRNVALTAAYAAVDRSFKEYRSRVVKRFGEEVDQQLRTGAAQVETDETVTDEKGKKHPKTVDVADPNASGSSYMKYFTRSNPNWEDDSDYIQMFFRAQQNYANDKLHADGHLTLNQVYQMLGFNDSKAGMVAGWIDDRKHPDSDGYVEFDIRKVYLPDEDGTFEEAYAVDFNVDGNIYDRMK